MPQQDPSNPRPQQPSDIGPLPPRYRDIGRNGNDNNWNSGIIGAAIVAALVVMGLIVWASTAGQQTATNPPAQTTGQSANPPPAPK